METTADALEKNIILSDDERATGLLSPENRKLGALLLHGRGYVILHGAVPVELVDRLWQSFGDLYADCQASMDGNVGWPWISRSTGTVFWEKLSRVRIFPKLVPPFSSSQVLANPFAVPILQEVLGEGFYCKSVSSDTCVKGAILQSPHRDIEFYDGDDPFGYIVNVPLMHCGLHNGPLEVWPGGSQHWKGDLFVRYRTEPNVQDGRNPAIEELSEYVPSKKIDLKPGDLLIRDPGMWHRGTPNPTDEPRTMLTISYFRRDYYYSYGDPAYNIDETMFEAMDPSAKALFAYCFTRTSPLYWKRQGHQAVEALEKRPWVGAPVRAGVRLKWRLKALRSKKASPA